MLTWHDGFVSPRPNEDDELESLLGASSVIGQAVDALVVNLGVEEEAAFALLVQRAETSGCRLREVAADVVRQKEMLQGDQASGHGSRPGLVGGPADLPDAD